MDVKLPNLDIAWKVRSNMDDGADRNALLLNWATEQNLERAGALASFLQDYYQFPSDELRAFITQCPHQADHKEINEAQNVATAYCDSINTLGTLQRDLATPGANPRHPGNFIRQRFYLEQFGHTLEHSTMREAVQKVSPDEIERLGIDVMGKINPTGDQDAIDFASDPLTRSARSFGFIVGQDGHLYRVPSKDIAEVDLKLNQCRDAQGQLTTGAVYQSIENLFAGNPIDQESQELLKRIYVDGENAYDKYRYTADRSLVPLAAVRQKIVQDITRGKKRVELVRFETLPENNHRLGMVILPIHVDYTGTAASPEDIAYHEQLWQKDPQKASRHQQIAASASSREKQYRQEITGLNSLSSTITEEMKQVHTREPYASQYRTLSMAQENMAENPDETREWVQLKMKKDQNRMMKDLSEALTTFWAGPEGNPGDFSAALDTLDRYMKIWVENDQIMAPPGQNPRYVFGAVQKLASMKEEDRAEKFYQLFHEPSGDQNSQMDTTENRLKGLQTSLQYFTDQEQASALTEDEKRRLEELDRKYLGCTEGEVSADRYLGTEKVFAQARVMKRDELAAMSHCMLEQIARYSQADFPPEQTRLCLKGLNETLSSLNLTQGDLDHYIQSLPQNEQQLCRDTLDWVHTTEQQALREPLSLNGTQRDVKSIFNAYLSLGINAVMYRDGYMDCMNRAEMNQLNSWRDYRLEVRQRDLARQPLQNSGPDSAHRTRTSLSSLEAQESGPDRQRRSARPGEIQRARSASRSPESHKQGPSK